MGARKIIVTLSLLAMVAAVSTEAQAQGGTYGGGVIAPGSPMLTLSGRSGGHRPANSMGGSCRGNIAAAPDHVVNITAPMNVRFEVLNAGGDTTMVLVGPSGVFCDDDGGNGFNPRIIRQLMPGVYQIFIGTYSGNNFYPYTMQIMGQGGMPMPVPTPVMPGVNPGGRYGGAVLGPGRMFASLSGRSGGPIQARTYGGHCRGWTAGMPDHVLTITSPMVLTFDVAAHGDTTLVITGPTGVLCDDDSGNGNNPRVTRPLSPGRYEVRVGSYSSGNFYPYTLSIHP